MNSKAPEINPKEVEKKRAEENFNLIDVRSEEEFTGELGHVPHSKLITLGPDLEKWIEKQSKDQKIIFICRSGNRSGQATNYMIEKGFKDVLNMKGGMLLWNELGLEKV
jgi:rhodanese-related sulfurtransferase